MPWLHLLGDFFGGAFLANALPHWVAGIQGKPFQTPFAKPPGKGLSSSTVNVLWAFVNLVVAYVLTVRVSRFDPGSGTDLLALTSGALLLSLGSAWNFGKLHGGNKPTG